MKTILSLICAVIILNFSLGCQRYKAEDFKTDEIAYTWGTVGAKLHGTIHDKKIFFATSGSPYDLFLWFNVQKGETVKIVLKNISLVSSDTSKIVFHQSNVHPSEKSDGWSNFVYKKPDDPNSQQYFFDFRKIDMEYSDMNLLLDFTVEIDGVESQYEADFELKKDLIKRYQMIGV